MPEPVFLPRHSRWIARICLTLAALSGPGAHAQELNEVALAFLKLHRVPCAAVTKTDTLVLDEIARCDDGREWALFWLENEVAFVQPKSRELYRWQWQLNELYPQLYAPSDMAAALPRMDVEPAMSMRTGAP